MTDVTKNGKDGPRRRPFAAIASWIEARGETAVALGGAIAATIYASVNKITKVEDLAPVILGVLVVIAVAMVIERERRIKEGKRLDRLKKDIERTLEGIEILRTPTPYHVILNESVYDIEANGDANAARLKKLRFTQDDVIAIVDWWRGEGDPESVERLVGKAKPIETTPPAAQRAHLKATDVVHKYESRARKVGLVPLDRAYVRDEECDYVVDRRHKGLFPKNPDRAWIAVLESTTRVRMVVRWSERHPTEIRLIRELGTASGRPMKFTPERLDDGRSRFRIDIPEPQLGERIGVEWDWPAPSEKTPEETPTGAQQVQRFRRIRWLFSAKYRQEHRAKATRQDGA